MPIELTCPGCGKQLRLADEHAGKAGRCPACQATFQIPTHSEQQSSASPFGAGAPQPFAPTPSTPSSPQPPNPFASTSNMQSPYGGTNPYSPPQTPNLYGGQSQPGEGMATASIVLGIISIVFSLDVCCCLNLFVGVPCGITGLILAFQTQTDKRKIGMILNSIGLVLCVLLFVGRIVLQFVVAANQ